MVQEIKELIFVIFSVFCFSVFFVLMFYVLNFFISSGYYYHNKVSSFESGFIRVGLIQNSFRIHFFVIMLMFVIFDLEIVIFIGVLVSDLNSFYSFLVLFLFIFFSFYMEW